MHLAYPRRLKAPKPVHGQEKPVARPRLAFAAAAQPRALSSFTPPQIAQLYGFPAGTGAGQTIAIVQLGGGYRAQDFATYFAGLKLPVPSVNAYSADGKGRNNPADTSGANVEVALDIEVAGAVAPGARINVYFAANTFAGFYAAVDAAIASQPCAVSISWGAPERSWPRAQLAAFDALFARAAAANINVFCAAGDNGSSDGAPGLNVDFPASSPNVIACGGTRLVATQAAIQSETVWNARGGATGGGFSTMFAKPAYQTTIRPASTFRGVPDVAANADPATGYSIYVGGKSMVVGGTSAVAPLLAGLCARVCQAKGGTRTSFWNNRLYARSGILCADVSAGNNGAFAASAGWDPCTGVGRIIGTATVGNL
jgi:kumamolisin